MADKKLTELAEVGTLAQDDLLYIVDVSDTTSGAGGTSKKVQASELRLANSVKAYGAEGDGVTDDASAISSAISGSDGAVYFPAGTYKINSQISISKDDLHIYSDAQAVIDFDSAGHKAFRVNDCDNVSIVGITFKGNSTETDIDVNNNAAIEVYNASNVTIERCRLNYGGRLFRQDRQANDYGMRVFNCYAYGFRNAHQVHHDSIVMGCHFEQPTDIGFDRVGNDGSTHAIYLFAQREKSTITGNTFKNIRRYGVQLSGTANPVSSIIVSDNKFDNCGGGVIGGADDGDNRHSNILIANNMFVDCWSQRAGWREGSAIRFFGTTALSIVNNSFLCTKEFGLPLTGGAAINIAGNYLGNGGPVINALIMGNNIDTLDSVTVADTFDIVINISDVDNVEVCHNLIRNADAKAFRVVDGSAVVVRDNLVNNVTTAFDVQDCTNPIVEVNRVITGGNTSGNQLITSGNTGGSFADNVEFGASSLTTIQENA